MFGWDIFQKCVQSRALAKKKLYHTQTHAHNGFSGKNININRLKFTISIEINAHYFNFFLLLFLKQKLDFTGSGEGEQQHNSIKVFFVNIFLLRVMKCVCVVYMRDVQNQNDIHRLK